MSRSTWTLALLAAAGIALYRQTRAGRPASTAPSPLNLAGSQDLDLPPAGRGAVPETMWTPGDPSDARPATRHELEASREP